MARSLIGYLISDWIEGDQEKQTEYFDAHFHTGVRDSTLTSGLIGRESSSFLRKSIAHLKTAISVWEKIRDQHMHIACRIAKAANAYLIAYNLTRNPQTIWIKQENT